MTRRPGRRIQPDRRPTEGAPDPVRDLTGGETAAEALARAEAELRRRPLRILDRLPGRKGPRA